MVCWTKLNFIFLLIDLNIWIHSSDHHQSNIINALTPWCSTCCSMPAGFSSKSSLSVAEVIMRQQDAIKASWYTGLPTIISVMSDTTAFSSSASIHYCVYCLCIARCWILIGSHLQCKNSCYYWHRYRFINCLSENVWLIGLGIVVVLHIKGKTWLDCFLIKQLIG